MRSAAIQAFDQVAAISSRAAACSGEGPSSSQVSPRILSQFSQGGIHRKGDRYRAVDDRLVSHSRNIA